MLDAGAVALVLKEAPLADLVRALEAALDGSSYLDPALAKNPAPGGKLTQRELDVLGLLAEGLQHEEIGRSSASAPRRCAPISARRPTGSARRPAPRRLQPRCGSA